LAWHLASAYWTGGRIADAIRLNERTLKQREAMLGFEHPDTLETRNNLASAYLYAGRTSEAISLFETNLRQHEARLGPKHPHTLISRDNVASAYFSAGRTADAIRLHEQNLEHLELKLPPDHPQTLHTRNNLATAYDSVREFAKAEAHYRVLLDQTRKRFGADDARTAGQMAWLGLNLLHQHKYTDAEPLLRDCLKVRAAEQPDDWLTFNTRSLLGGALLGQKRYAEAEPLLLQGYEGMKAREARIPAHGKIRLSEGLERLVQLYEAMDKQDEAAKWRKQLEESNAAQKNPKS
jgi:tetratricopeptide (TPR) repeat protein